MILVALGYLLIIDYQHRCKEEHNTEQQTEEKQHTVHAVHVVAGAVYRALRKTDGYRIAVFFSHHLRYTFGKNDIIIHGIFIREAYRNRIDPFILA